MSAKNILFLGFGDIASRTCELLGEHRLVGVARSAKATASAIEFWRGAVDAPNILAKLAATSFDAVVITLTPAQFSDEAYRLGYVEPVKKLVELWQRGNAPQQIIFVSSTSVYSQSDGQWVDEDSVTVPQSFSGQRLLEAEQCLGESGLAVCILRFAGIYGPGRDHLLRQVRAGAGGNDAYGNRIHVQDCAAMLAFLLRHRWQGSALAPLYLGCDSLPASGSEVHRWLAQRIGICVSTLQPSSSSRGGNKRCSNQRILKLGYQLQFASYREGYSDLLGEVSG